MGNVKRSIKIPIIIGIGFILILTTSCSSTKPDIQSQSDSVIEVESQKVRVFATGFKGADGITIDYAGNMYVGNRKSNVISKVNKEGEVQDFVALQCSELLCMTADNENNIYAAGKDKVFKITSQGNVTVLAEDFTCADDLRLDQKGNLYITDSFENRVYKLTPDLHKSIFIDSDISQETLGIGWHITGITFDNEFKSLYIAKMKEGKILRYPINDDGIAGNPEIVAEGLREPDHLEIDKQGRIYVTLFRTGSLIRIDNTGNIEYLSEREMGHATGIILGKSGFDEAYAYVADYAKDIVFQIKIN